MKKTGQSLTGFSWDRVIERAEFWRSWSVREVGLAETKLILKIHHSLVGGFVVVSLA